MGRFGYFTLLCLRMDRAPLRDRTLVLRVLVPGLEARLRDKMKEAEDVAPVAPKSGNGGSSNDIFGDLEGVTCEPTSARNNTIWNFHCDGATYPARLVNLPCPVELHKTHDHAIYFKSADVAQMLIVYEDEMALEESDEKCTEGFPSYYHSGLAPPTKRIVERRFAAREHKALPPQRSAISEVETDLVQLMENIAKDEKGKRSKVPTLTSANKVLEEVVEEVVDYEPWMSDYGRQPQGVEFNSDDQMCSLHPEVWLSPSEIQECKDQDESSKKKKEQAAQRKEAQRREKDHQSRKGSLPKKNDDIVDEVTQAAASMLTTDATDLVDDDLFDFNLDDEDMMNFDMGED